MNGATSTQPSGIRTTAQGRCKCGIQRMTRPYAKRQVVVWAPGMFLVFFLFFTYELDFFFRFDDNDTTPCPTPPLRASARRVAMGPAPGLRQVLRHTAPPPACEPLLIGGNGGAYDRECGQMRQQVLNLAKKICARPGDKYDAPLSLQREMVGSFFLSFVCLFFILFLSISNIPPL